MPDQSGKIAMVTGANTGIGFETALALYEAGAHVVITCRTEALAQDTIHRLKAASGKGSVDFVLLDLSSLASVKKAAEGFLQHYRQLHLLINNAGVMVPPEGKTAEGYELQFGVNFLGHFALTGRLYPALKATPGARIVTLSSLAYLRGRIDFTNLRSEHSYDAMREYAQSKLADVLFAVELQRRIATAGDEVLSIAAQPGANNTSLSRKMNEEELAAAMARVGPLMEPWQGALPSLFAATTPEIASEVIYEPDQDGGYRGYPTQTPIIPAGLDMASAQQLWAFAEDATGICFPVERS